MEGLRFCGECLSRGWVLASRHQGGGMWQEAKALCPTCSGLSVRDVTALYRQAAAESWLRRRDSGTAASRWDEYDWEQKCWVEAREAERRSA